MTGAATLLRRDLLQRVQKPARYTGGEYGAAPAWRDAPLRVCLGYPDVYEIGMSSLGVQILYYVLNRDPRFSCERVFAPWIDMEEVLRTSGERLFALESGDWLTALVSRNPSPHVGFHQPI